MATSSLNTPSFVIPACVEVFTTIVQASASNMFIFCNVSNITTRERG